MMLNWNDCSSCLPPFYQEVLVVVNKSDKRIIGIGQRKQFPQAWEIIGHGTFLKDDVTHWIPLPQIPE